MEKSKFKNKKGDTDWIELSRHIRRESDPDWLYVELKKQISKRIAETVEVIRPILNKLSRGRGFNECADACKIDSALTGLHNSIKTLKQGSSDKEFLIKNFGYDIADKEYIENDPVKRLSDEEIPF